MTRSRAQLLDEIALPYHREGLYRVKPVSVGFLPYSDGLIRIELSLPVADAIARAPALARALGAPADDSVPADVATSAPPTAD